MIPFFERHARIIVIIAVVFGSTSGTLGKMITADPMAIGFFRLTFTLPFFLVPVLLHRRPGLLHIPLRDYALAALSGFFLFCHFFCWFTAVKSTSVASAVILADLHPLAVMAISLFWLKVPVPPKAALGVFIALLGGALIVGFDAGSGGSHIFGDAMALAAAMFMALYFSIGGVVRKRMDGNLYILTLFSVCWLSFLAGMFVSRTPFTGYPASDFLWLVVMALLCQLGSHAVFNWSMRHVSSLFVSAWGTMEMVSASLLAFLVLGEVPGIMKLLGGTVVIGGLLYYNYHENDKLASREI